MAPTPEQVEALRDAYGGIARKESQIRQDYGGLALEETRRADDLEKAAEARRTASWSDQVEGDRVKQEAGFAEKAGRMADWQDTVDLDATLQERSFAERAARLRAAAGLPAIAGPVAVGPVLSTPAGMTAPDAQGFTTTDGGERMRILGEDLPVAPMMVPAAPPAPPPESLDATIRKADEALAASRKARGAPEPPPAGAAIFAKPPASAGPQGAGLGDRASLVAQGIWAERQAELDRLAKGGGTYRIPATPEREQATDVHRERALGYDPAILERQIAIESNPNALTEEAARPNQAPAVAYDPAVLAAMIAPPPEAKTPKERAAYYAGLAAKASAEGMSLRTLLASPDVKLAAPRGDLRPLDDAEAQVYSDAHKAAFAAITEPFTSTGVDLRDPANAKLQAAADRDAKLAAADALNRSRIMENAGAIDRTNATTRAQFDEGEAQRLRQVDAQRATNEEKYGPAGQLGFEQEKLRLEAQGHEATADAEREMAKVAGDAVAAGEKLRARADAEKPGIMQSILGVIGAGLGAFGQGMVGGPNQYIQAAQHRIESQAKSLTDDVAVQKGIEISRYEQIKHNLQAKLATGMSEQSTNAAKQMLGQIELKQLGLMKELSAGQRGTEKTASKVIPARAASVGGGGGSRLKTLLAMRGDEEANAKLAKEQGGEAPKKSEKPEVGVLNGTTYELRNVTSSTEGHEARKLLRTWDGIDASVKQLEEAASSYGQRGYNPARLEFLANQVGAKLSIASGQGVVTNPEAERNVKAFSSWVDPKAVVRDVRKMLQDDRNAMLSQLGATTRKK